MSNIFPVDFGCKCNVPECMCGAEERPLRAYISNSASTPMTPEQRDWCLQEIEHVEGYRKSDYINESDANLARGVLSAWTDFARDKGLL